MNINNLQPLIPASIYAQLPDTIRVYNLTTPLRLAHFLSQCFVESGGFKVFVENLNYSAQGLLKTWPTRFNQATAQEFARQPQRIANRVYANRMGNGNEASNHGWLYRGRGAIQLTGRDNYRLFDLTVNDDILNNPDLVATKYSIMSAGWFWQRNNLNSLADKGSTSTNVAEVTKRVNGGTHGLQDRLNAFNRFFKALNS